MKAADYRAEHQAFVERVASYAEAPDAFRNRWRLAHFRFRWSSWLVAALFLIPLAWFARAVGDVHLALKAVLGVMALIAVLPLAWDFRRPQCALCEEEPERISVRKLSGDGHVITACHHCRVFKAEEADSSPLPL